MIATRAARTGCIFTLGADANRGDLEAEVLRRCVELGLRCVVMTNEPRLNCVPPASNGSSAAWMSAFLTL